jgi:hypothetical protein
MCDHTFAEGAIGKHLCPQVKGSPVFVISFTSKVAQRFATSPLLVKEAVQLQLWR